MKVPFLKRISMRCLKSSSFYNAGSNNSQGLTRKSKNRIKRTVEYRTVNKKSNIKSIAEYHLSQSHLLTFP